MPLVRYVRYYLCPPEDPDIARYHGCNACPRGVHQLGGDTFGVLPPSQTGGPEAWVIGIRRDDLGAFPNVEAISSGCRIGTAALPELSAAGVDVSGLSVASPEEDVEKRVVLWLRGEMKTFADLCPLKPDDVVDYP